MSAENGKLDVVEITRNGITAKLEPTKIKRGEKKDTEYLGLKVTDDNYEQIGKWLGKENLVSMYRGKINQRLQSLFNEACSMLDPADPKHELVVQKPFDIVEFTELASAFSARGDTMESIKDEIEDLTEELVSIDWAVGGAAGRAQEIVQKVAQLRNAREAKRRDRGEKKEEKELATASA